MIRRSARQQASASVIAGLILSAAMPAFALTEPTGYLVPAPQASDVKDSVKSNCSNVPSPIVTLATMSKYNQKDVHHAEEDPAAKKAYEEAITPVRDYSKGLMKIANGYVRSHPRNPAMAACALDWLDGWAHAGAMTQMTTKQASLNQGQAIGGYALAYLQIRNAPGLDEAKKKEVVAWLNKLGHQSKDFMNSNDGHSGANNHRYWNGLSSLAAGIASDDKDLIAWGIDSARLGLEQIEDDGTMPLEVDRGKRARDYHNFAAEPLVAIAELAKTQGVDLYKEQNGALHKLVKRVIASYNDPSFFEKKTGFPQEPYPDGSVPASKIGWVEIYDHRFPSAEVESLLASKRDERDGGSLGSTDLGGNMTLLFHGVAEKGR